MTTPKIAIHNAQTGEIEIREMNAEELTQFEADQEAALLLEATND